MIAFMVIDYHVLFDIAPILYGIGIVLLLYLMVFGRLTANVRSWIHIGGFQFQPSEFHEDLHGAHGGALLRLE